MKKVLIFVLTAAVLMLTACGQTPAKEVALKDVMSGLAETYGLEEGMLILTADDLMELYGIQAADVKQFEARMQLESLMADEIVLIEAMDAQAAGRVKEKLEGRYQSKLNETRDYLPDEFAKIENSKVSVNGNFVAMIVLGEAEAAQADWEKALKY